MICPSCGKKNAAENRFCGNCGVRLESASRREPPPEEPRTRVAQRTPTLLGLDLPVRETHYPREGYEPETETPPVTSLHEELPPELIEYDRRIPLIAEPGMERRQGWEESDSNQDVLREDTQSRDVAAARNQNDDRNDVRWARDEVRAQEQAPVREPERVEERRAPRAPHSSAVFSSILGLNSPTADELGMTETARTPAEQERATVPILTEQQREPERGHFLDFSEPVREGERESTSLHGPSFLGLSSATDEEYVEEPTVSHARRNFAIAVLVLLALLIALQWRSIRDFGARYTQNGGISIPGMKKPAADNAAAQNANNSTAVNSGAAANGGKPQEGSGEGPNIEVAPAQNPAASNNPGNDNPPAEPAGRSVGPAAAADAGADPKAKQEEASGANTTNGNAVAAGSDESEAAKAQNAGTGTDVAANTKAGTKNGDTMPQGEPDEVADEPEARPAAKRQPARQPAEDPPQGGAAELTRANATDDPGAKASLLWRSTAKGNPIAPVQLAELYLSGGGVPQDCEQALILLRSAAAKKNPRARTKLGSLYATGQCVEQDRVQAYHWMSLALQVNPGSEWVERNRESLWAQMTPDERQRAARDR